MNEIYYLLKKTINELETERIFIHTDLLRGFKLKLEPNHSLLDAHCKLLINFNKDIYLPAFNYEFPKSRLFDVENLQSKVGVINEHFRKNYANWQTPIPIFSVTGTGNYPEINFQREIDPFDEKSIFAFLYRTNSLLLFYGAQFSSTTMIHYVERISNMLNYRYDKFFEGDVIYKGIHSKVNLKLHVRPMGKRLEYDWKRLENDLKKNDLIKYFEEKSTNIMIIQIKFLIDFWIERIKQDPYYFLDDASKNWVEELLAKLGRKFNLSDFENN